MCPIATGIFTEESRNPIPRNEWVARIAANEESDRNFWSGEVVPAKTFVELPFWLMTENATFKLTYEGCTATLSTHGDFSEVVSDAMFLDSRRNLLFIGPLLELGHAKEIENATCPVVRPQKTVVEIDVMALAAAFSDFLGSDTRPINRAAQYFSSLALVHIPFINLLVGAYRSASRDPYAFEISEWDVPVWWFRLGDQLVRTGVMPYWNNDDYPGLTEFATGNKTPYIAASTSEIQTAVRHPFSPGRTELLDAMSLMYRGRYGDAIRSAVTAIEIVVEEKLGEALRLSGCNEQAIKERLEETRDSFHKRIEDYEQVSRRRLPGPMVSPIPHLNGLRLKVELETVRVLRHKIVHEGFRVDSRGQTLRAIETMTWLYDWFTEDRIVPISNHRNYEFFCAMRGNQLFPWQYTLEGVRVFDRPTPSLSEDGKIVTTDDITAHVFATLLEPTKNDVELFVRMGFASLEVELEDASAELKGDPFLRERYRAVLDGIPRLIFCISFDGLPSTDLVECIASTCTATTQETSMPWKAIAVIHHEQHLPTKRRKVEAAVTEDIAKLAWDHGITIVTAIEFRQLINGVGDGLWSNETVIKVLSIAGRPATPPPGFRKVGVVRTFYERASVLSVQLDEGSRIRIGETFCTEAVHPIKPEKISSLQINRQPVHEAVGPLAVGVSTSSPKKAFVKGRCVYICSALDTEQIEGVESEPN